MNSVLLEMERDHPEIGHDKANPDRYPEIKSFVALESSNPRLRYFMG